MNIEYIGIFADKIDSLIHAGSLPMDPAIKLNLTLASLAEIVLDMRDIYIKETGENPWE